MRDELRTNWRCHAPVVLRARPPPRTLQPLHPSPPFPRPPVRPPLFPRCVQSDKAAKRVDCELYDHRVLMLQAATSYEQNDLPTCKALVDQMLPDEPDTIVNSACILYREDKYEEARQKFVDGVTSLGYSPDLAYNISLCYYRQAQYGPALKHIAEIIEKGVREHPELSVGSNTDGIEVRCWAAAAASAGCSRRVLGSQLFMRVGR